MDREILCLIHREAAALPEPVGRGGISREQLYIAGKRKLCEMFRGHEESVSKAVARRYRL